MNYPDNWQYLSIKECCSVVSGSTPKRNKPEYWDGEIDWVTPKDLSNLKIPVLEEAPEKITELGYKSCSTTLLPQGSILFSSRAPIGLIAIAGKEMCTNQGFKSLVPNQSVDSAYLYWCIRYFTPQLAAQGSGTTFKELSKTIVEKFRIPLPPLEEQKRIAAILDKADAIRRKRKEAIALTEELLRSTFLDMFGDPGENPHKFEIGCLKEVCYKVTDGTHHMPKTLETGIPILRALNIKNDSIDKYDLVYISEEEYVKISKRSPLEIGDVLLTCLGTIGNVAIFREKEQFSLVRNIALIKPNFQKATSEFLQFLLKTKYLQAQMKARARQSSQAALYIGEIEKLKVLLPPIHLQNKFSDFCKQSNKILISNQQNYSEQDNLFNSLLQKAFRGEL